MKLAEEPGSVLRGARPGDHRLPGDAVDRVQLDPARGEQLPARADQAESLNLLGITPGGRENQHRAAGDPPPHDRDLAMEPVGEPSLARFHGVTHRRTSADQEISITAPPAADRASSPRCARRAPRPNGRPCRRPRTWEPWTGCG